ncbi:hypothetical protein [Streptomyces bobili]|uniref:hypothetical protein n=1 Tax=Streptomyces bobili TaxID=67280 RepID=UPI00371015A3
MDDAETPFARECAARGWDRPAAFLRAFETTADLMGEPVAVTDRQFRRWRRPDPPRPRPRAWRVLHAMFGMGPLNLGFPGPAPSATVEVSPGPTEGVPWTAARSSPTPSAPLPASPSDPPTR